MWKRGEIAPKEQFLLFSILFYIYISNFRSQITYSLVKCGCSIYCFPHSLNSDMSKYGYLGVSVSPLEFEITRVDCNMVRSYGIFSKFGCLNHIVITKPTIGTGIDGVEQTV